MTRSNSDRAIVECAQCGAAADAAAVTCPVCELPLDGSARANTSLQTTEPEASTFAARAWQSGRGAVIAAAAFFVAATFAPLVTVQRAHEVGPRVRAAAWQLALGEGMYGAELKSAVVLAIPAAALGLLSFVWSRRSGPIMRASRPLVLVVSIIPLAAAVLPLMRMNRLERFKYEPGVAIGLVVLGTVLGVIGSMRFGTGVPELRPQRGRVAVNTRDDDD